jgi:hypothetical protein
VAENNPNLSPVSPSESEVTAYWATARHSHNKLGQFAMVDGSAIAAKTNDFWEDQNTANGGTAANGALEWQTDRKIYWYPTPTTPN